MERTRGEQGCGSRRPSSEPIRAELADELGGGGARNHGLDHVASSPRGDGATCARRRELGGSRSARRGPDRHRPTTSAGGRGLRLAAQPRQKGRR